MRVRKLFKIAAYLLVAVTLVLLLLAGAAYWATQQEPEFYQQAMKMDPVAQEKAGDELERKVLNLRNELRHEERWEATFTDIQLNGWLAKVLPKKFPDALPATVANPRVAIDPEEAKIAFRYQGGNFSSVVWLGADIYLTDEPDELAIRILKARAGSLPIPLSQFLDQVTEAARKSGLELRWSQLDGDPVARLQLNVRQGENGQRRLHLDTVELRDGEVYLSGEVKAEAVPSGSSGALHTAVPALEIVAGHR